MSQGIITQKIRQGGEKVKKEFNEEWDAQRDLLFGKEKAAELRKRQERRETMQLIAAIIFSILPLALLIKLIVMPR